MIDSYSISKDGLKGYRKSAIIWAEKGNTGYPIAYLRKPKHLTPEIWQEVLACIKLEIPVELAKKL